MDSAHPIIPGEFFTLKQAAEMLAVSVDTLLEWNDNNILKPTITQNGEIGYRKEQIDKFLTIQKFIQNPIQSSGQLLEFHTYNKTAFQKSLAANSNFYQSNTDKISNKIITTKSPKIKYSKLHSLGLISSFSVIAISLTVILLTQQNMSNPLPDHNVPTPQIEAVNLEKVSASQIGQIKSSGSATTVFEVPMENKNAPNNLSGTDINASEDKLAALYSIFEKETATTAANIHNQKPVVLVPEQIEKTDILADSNTDTTITNYSIIGNLASRPNSRDTETTVFDNNGNIKGETASTNLLAINLGTKDVVQSDKSLKQTVLPNILLGLLTLGLLSGIFIFKKQPAYSLIKTNATEVIPPSFINDTQEQKILEIDQKTDGTVVLYFHGEEYKVSKPELNSESDQFIERLLGFVSENVKEINYDILEDEKVRLNAPLSKLVTRLGFVGLKRDLFFPRTSKNRVLFRRYLTEQDLAAMNLTTDQISNELKN